MQDQRIQDGEPPNLAEQDYQIDNVVIDCMLVGAPWPWSVQELAREIGNEVDAVDSVGRLVRRGLLHRSGEFVFPTRAARSAHELQLGTA
jgi:hypothetical protein